MKLKVIPLFLMVMVAMLLMTASSARSEQAHLLADLPKPVNINCVGWEEDTVVIGWKDNATGEDGYKIERSDNGGAWAQIATVAPNSEGKYDAYRDTGMDTTNQGHRYRIRSYSGSDNSLYSDICNNRRIYDPQNFRIFYGLEGTADDCPDVDGRDVCLADDASSGGSGYEYVDLIHDSLQGSADSFFRLGYAHRADEPYGSLDKIPINVVWCDGGGCAGGGGIGLSPLLIEKPFDLTTRVGDPVSYMVALHELFHFLQGKYYWLNDANDRWVIEGQARSIQDKICIGGNRSTALCFDDIATGDHCYVCQVNQYLGNPNRPIGETSYSAALFWTYLTEKYGTSNPADQVENGLNIMLEFWEASENNHDLSGVATLNKALESLGHSERFRDIWKDFAVASYAKDYEGVAKYQYADMDQPGGAYNPVALSADEGLSLGESYLDTDESVYNWGAKYYQFRPDGDVPFVDIKITQDSMGDLYYTVLGIRGSNIVYEHNTEARDLDFPLLNDSYDKVAVIVAGLENIGNFRIAVNSAQPTLNILGPTAATKARVDDPSAPGKFLVMVEVVDGSGIPMVGIDLDNFSFRVGNVNVPADHILGASILMGQEWFVLRAPNQPNPDGDGTPSTYELTVNYGTALSDSEDDAVDYTPRNNADSMILLDRSGSMSWDDKLINAQNAAKLFVDSWRTGDKMGLVSFNSTVTTNMVLSNWTDSPDGGTRQDIFDYIEGLVATGGTRIGDSLIAGYNELKARGVSTHDWALVLLSDGDETDPGTRTFDQAVNDIKDSTDKKPAIHSIAVGPDADRVRMQNAAAVTGGTYQYISAPATLSILTPEAQSNLTPDRLSDLTPDTLSSLIPEGTLDIADMGLAMDYRYRNIATDVLGHQQVFAQVGPEADGNELYDIVEINVEPGAGELILTLSWDYDWSYMMDYYHLYDPDEHLVAPFQSDGRHAVWRVPNPMAGTWLLYLYAWQGPTQESSQVTAPTYDLPAYLVQASLKTDVTMDAFIVTPVNERVPGQLIRFAASLSDNAPISGAGVIAVVEKPDHTLGATILFDDGNHEDGEANDGIYVGDFYQTGQQGSYNVTILAGGYSPSLDSNFLRSKVLSFHMARVNRYGNEIPENDSDGDTLPDAWEIFFMPFTDPNVADCGADPDQDGLTNCQEFEKGTNPGDPDTDDDGESDLTDPNPFIPNPDALQPPEAHAYPGVGQVFIKYTTDPDYALVGLFRDEDDDMDELFTFNQLQLPTGVFTDTGVINGHQYCYVVVVFNTDGDRSSFSAPTCAVPNVDPLGPHGGVLINGGAAATLLPDVMLDLWASDQVDPAVEGFGDQFLPPEDSASGVTEMMISNSPDFSGAAWEPYATSKPWMLAQNSGLASVYVKYRDALNNESETYVATIWVGSGPGLLPTYLPLVSK
jgi:Mg-chelatase subunit ChlD